MSKCGLDETFALSTFPRKLSRTTNSLGFLPRFFLRWLFKICPGFHFPEQAFALHLFLQRAQRLLDIIVADGNLNNGQLSIVYLAAGRTCALIWPL